MDTPENKNNIQRWLEKVESLTNQYISSENLTKEDKTYIIECLEGIVENARLELESSIREEGI